MNEKILWTPEDLPFTGMASYYDSVPGALTLDPRVYLRLEVGNGDIEILAMVDTAGNFMGYQGFLERFRFAVDPAMNRFYFGSL